MKTHSFPGRLAALALASSWLLLCSCQHTQLNFEPVAAPTLADFSVTANDSLPPFPQIAADKAMVSIMQGPGFAIDPRLEQSQLVLASPAQTIADADHIGRALQAIARNQALGGDLCAERMTIVARLHSLVFSSNCETPLSLKHRAEQLMNSLEKMSEHDFARILREQKLSRHIEAFSGADIDRLWARQVLGLGHPYLDYNKPFDGSLAQLAEGLSAFRQGASVQLLGDKRPQNAGEIPFTLVTLEQSASSNGGQQVRSPIGDQTRRLYLLDAPGQVQAQVRIGYGLAPTGSSDSCEATAALLGRSHGGRLFFDLRSQRGLTYGVYGTCIDNPLSRTLKFYGASANESAGAFIRAIVDHLTLLGEKGATEAELDALQSFLAGRQKLKADTPGAAIADWLYALERGQSRPNLNTQGLDRTALAHFIAEVLSQPPMIVVKGDASIIEADLATKLPGWQIEKLDKMP